MKLVALRFQGVGPYRDEFAIDFAALSAGHMFLIDGETGAGKTTILDCITFALYGSISGNSDGRGVGGRGRIRSRFLSASPEETYVDLIFRIGDDYYEILRRPDYDRAKRRGEGVTHNPASARMLHLDRGLDVLVDESRTAAMDGGLDGRNDAERYFTYAQEPGHATVVTTSVREVTGEVERLLGIDRGQFSKTVILAQGRFAEFLRMKPEDRTALVRDLFSAEEYEEIQKSLDARRLEESRKVDDLRSRLREAVGAGMRNAAAILAELRKDAEDGGPKDDGTGNEGMEAADSEDADSGRDSAQDAVAEPVGHDSPAFWGLDDSGDVDEGHLEPEQLVDAISAAAKAVAEDSRRLIDRRRACSTQLDKRWSALRDRQERLSALVEAAAGKRDALRKAHDVHALDAAIAEDDQACSDAERARPVAEACKREKSDRSQLDDLTGRLEDARRSLSEFETADELDRLISEAVAAAAGEEAAKRAREVADGHAALLDRVVKAGKTLTKAQTDYDEAETAVAEAGKAREALPEATEIENRREELTRLIADRDHLRERHDHAEDVLAHARARDAAAAKVAGLRKAETDAAAARTAADEAYDQARRRFDEAGASRFAAMLENGRPCPVCGSLDHPHPAAADEGAPDKSRLASLRRKAGQALADLEKARADLSTATAALAAEDAACEGASVEDALKAMDELTARLDDAGDPDRLLSDCRKQSESIDRAEKTVQSARMRLAESDARLDAVRQEMDAAAGAAEGISADGVRKEREDAEEALKEAREQSGRARTLRTRRAKRDELDRKVERLRATHEEVAGRVDRDAIETADALKASGFADLDAAMAAVLDSGQIKERRHRIEAHRQKAAAADSAVESAGRVLERQRADLDPEDAVFVADLDAARDADAGGRNDEGTAVSIVHAGDTSDRGSVLDAVRGVADVDDETLASLDLAPLADQVSAAQTRRDLALRALQTAEGLDGEREQCGHRAMEAATAFSDAMASFLPIRDMALLACGNTPNAEGQRVTLVTYAVTERFRDVLDRANDLLRDIHDGVYELRLGDHEGRAGGRTGLPIEVYDRRSDTTCEPATLSGGETFFVSLALALALADVIRAEAGGAAMDTLFVDEGFGTLSQDYLDEVMEVLRGIARTRDVGIISHVGQLRDQIGPRISVSRVREDAESRLEVVL